MRYGPLAALILVLAGWAVPASADAQDTPRTEVFGGYAWARDDDRDMNGWDGSITFNLGKWFGVSADVSGLRTSLGNTALCQYAVLAGPRVSVPMGRFTPFGYALAGAFHARSRLEFLSVSNTEGTTEPAVALGGGVNVMLSGRWAGAVKADAAVVRSDGRTDVAPRVFGGVVLRLGRR